jgi:hypothetical protein
VQKTIDFSLISEFNNDINKISLELKRFSSPPYLEDGFITVIVGMFPYIILLSFTFIVIINNKINSRRKRKWYQRSNEINGNEVMDLLVQLVH